MQTYSRNVIAGVASKSSIPISARVQESAVSELPAGVRADVVADCDGIRRMLAGLKPVAERPRLIHALDVDLPISRSVPTVATVHDLAVFDVPWAFSRLRATGERALLRANLKRADRIIAVSQFTADRLGERLGLSATVTHLAPEPGLSPADSADVESVRQRYQLPETFVLHVGNVEPRKGIGQLAQACAKIGVPLVLAGSIQTELAVDNGVVPLGYVPSVDLAALYGAATVVAYPSLYEGFGLPPIEALACGAIVVTTRVGALPEVLGTEGYPLAKAGDLEELTELLDSATKDPEVRGHMADVGASAVSKLSWATNANQVLAIYASLGVVA